MATELARTRTAFTVTKREMILLRKLCYENNLSTESKCGEIIIQLFLKKVKEGEITKPLKIAKPDRSKVKLRIKVDVKELNEFYLTCWKIGYESITECFRDAIELCVRSYEN